MPSDPDNKPPSPGRAAGSGAADDPRRDRLARALRDNLKKRKAQQRQRQAAARPGEGSDDAAGGR